jgi:iron complex transport system ATP-binding protein
MGVVRRLARDEGKAVLAVLHDLNLAAATCDAIVAVSDGEVVANGPPSEVLTGELMRHVFGVEVEVAPSEATGRPILFISPPVEPIRTPIRGRAHVIGGAGRGAGAMRALAEIGFEVTAGVLHSGDTDAFVAERLGLLRVTVPPFSSIDHRSLQDCRDAIGRASVLVVADAPYGPGNLPNLRLAVEAAQSGSRTVLVQQIPIEERDFTGGEATVLWRRLQELGETVGRPEELATALLEDAPERD